MREAARRQLTVSLERSARDLTGTTYVVDLLGALDGFKGSTIADLVDLMRRYNLHFAPADSPEERGLYQQLYPPLVKRRAALGMNVVGAAPANPDAASVPVVPVVGLWHSNRGTTAVPSIFEFRADGSMVFERYGKRSFGEWRREGNRITMNTASPDPRLVLSNKWFVVASAGRKALDVVMEGVRPYSWKALLPERP